MVSVNTGRSRGQRITSGMGPCILSEPTSLLDFSHCISQASLSFWRGVLGPLCAAASSLYGSGTSPLCGQHSTLP